METTNGVVELALRNNGLITILDAEDFEKVSQYNWYFSYQTTGPSGYVRNTRNVKGNLANLHRFILDAKPGQIIDHIDRDTLNNRRSNLRICTTQQNGFNRGPNTGKQFKGVYEQTRVFRTKRFRSSIKFNQNFIYLGNYETAKEAARAYDVKAKELFGEFARFNFPYLVEA